METQLLYRNKGFRILAALVASYYILFHGRSPDFIGELKNPVFYIAFTVSFAIALLLVTWVHFVTTSLDARFDWHMAPKARLFRQFVFGILVPLVFDFTLMSVYFYFMGTSIFDNGFMRYDFPMIICFVVMLNLYYTIYYFFLASKIEYEREKLKAKGNTDSANILVVNYEEDIEWEDKKKEVSGLFPEIEDGTCITDYALFFYASDKYVYMVNYKEEEILINWNLTRLTEVLAEVDFFRINRSVIINSALLCDYMNGEKRDTLSLEFRSSYWSLIDRYGQQRFTVTKNYVPAIISYFDAP